MGEAAELLEGSVQTADVGAGVLMTNTCMRAYRYGRTGRVTGWSGIPPAIHEFRGPITVSSDRIPGMPELNRIAGFANSIMGRSTPAVPAVVFSKKLAALNRACLSFTPGEDRSGKGRKIRIAAASVDQGHHEDEYRYCHGGHDHCNRVDVHGTLVLALVIVDQSGGRDQPAATFFCHTS